MISNVLEKISFWALYLTIVLMPLFFLPFSKIPVETSKGLLVVLGLAVSLIFWVAARFSKGNVVLPKSFIALSALGIVVSFLLSALFSSNPQISLFGIMFDIGTFWFMFTAFMLMLISSVVLKEPKYAKKVFWGIIISFIVISVFQILHVMMPETLKLGVLGGKTANVFGSWSAFGLYAGFIGVISLFAVEFFSTTKKLKRVLGLAIVLSLFTAALVNFALIWKLLGVFALIIFVYKVSQSMGGEEGSRKFPTFSMAVVMVSLLFIMAGQFIGTYIPSKFGLASVEIGPSFGATMQVTKSVLAKDPIFGVGPNRFGEAWSMYKPQVINSTQFWDATFDSGSGLIPTFATTTGILGIVAWLAFLFFFFKDGMKAIFTSIKNSSESELSTFFVGALYLMIASFFYSGGAVILLLTFAFTGIFVGLYSNGRGGKEINFSFLHNPKKTFVSIMAMVIIMIATAAAGFKYLERFISVSYFGKALAAQNIETAESSINRAVNIYQNDLYLRTYAQVYLVKLNSLASKGSTLTDQEKLDLQGSFDRAVAGAQLATNADKTNYINFRALGAVYETVGSYGVTGAYDRAVEAYQKASELSPNNPGLQLAISRISFVEGKVKEAKEYATKALKLKNNYIDALIVLSQVAKSEGDMTSAINYAETALSLSPTNKDLIQYVNSLKGTGN